MRLNRRLRRVLARRAGGDVALDLRFNRAFATLDGNHRIAVALRLGLDHVPVALQQVPVLPRPGHAKAMTDTDYRVLIAALEASED